MSLTLREKLGVNIHSSQASYANNIQQVKDQLLYLGGGTTPLTYIRDNGVGNAKLFSGVNVLSVCGVAWHATSNIAGGSWQLELPNETDNQFPAGESATLTWQQALQSSAAKIFNTAAGRKIFVGASLANSAGSPTVGGTVGIIRESSYANVHSYRGRRPEDLWWSRFNDHLTSAKLMAPGGAPVVVTETGYWWANPGVVTNTTGHVPTPEDEQAATIIPMLLGFWARDILRVYLYELQDNPAKVNNNQGHFGLFYADGTPKPVATAIHDFMAKYGDLTHNDVVRLLDQSSTNPDNSQVIIDLQSQITDLSTQVSTLQANNASLTSSNASLTSDNNSMHTKLDAVASAWSTLATVLNG